MYQACKDWIQYHLALPDAALHIHAGLALLFVARLVLRRRLHSFIPFYLVCLVAVANEMFDRAAFGSWRWEDSLSDLANTVFWPFILSLTATFRHIERFESTERSGSQPSSEFALGDQPGRHPA